MTDLRSLLFPTERVDAQTEVAVGYTFWFGAVPVLIATAMAWAITHLAATYVWVAVTLLGPVGIRVPIYVFVACLYVTLAVMLSVAVRGLLVMRTSRHMITSLRVLSQTGILSKRLQQVELRRVSQVEVRRSIIGRALRYGHVSIDSGNVAAVVTMKFIHEPDAWAGRIRGAQRSHFPITSAYENTPL